MRMRASLTEVSSAISKFRTFIHPMHFVDICSSSAPSIQSKLSFLLLHYNHLTKTLFITVPFGGYLYECYLNAFASRKHHKAYRKMCNSAKRNGSIFIADADNQAIVKETVIKFYGWAIYNLNSICHGCRLQQFYHTFCATFYGLSRSGVRALGRFCLCSKLTYLDEMKDHQYDLTKNERRYLIFTICSRNIV